MFLLLDGHLDGIQDGFRFLGELYCDGLIIYQGLKGHGSIKKTYCTRREYLPFICLVLGTIVELQSFPSVCIAFATVEVSPGLMGLTMLLPMSAGGRLGWGRVALG